MVFRMISFSKFIRRARAAHRENYDYDADSYSLYIKPMRIYCKVHGWFYQKPVDHCLGKGCALCGAIRTADSKRSSNGTFVSKSIKKHGGSYDYSKTEYKGSTVKVIITCPLHGDFHQTPADHLAGCGCKGCGITKAANSRTLSLDSCLTSFREAHGSTYDYSRVVYTKSTDVVDISCRTHGWFKQRATEHASGRGCQKCAKTYRRSTEVFINEAKVIHGDRYDYSLTEFIKTSAKVTIVCKDHGPFEQIPNSHLKGLGCYRCGRNSVRTTEDFLKKAKEVHGDLYDYSLVNYTKSMGLVKIICREHGVFEQLANAHLSNKGCGKCSSSKGEFKIAKMLDNLGLEYVREYILPGSGSRFRFDFYLPKLGILLEYHGEQHFRYVPYFHRNGDKDFEKQKHRDIVVREMAKAYGFKYLHLSNVDFNNISESFLRRLLSV